MFKDEYKLDLPRVTHNHHAILKDIQIGTYNSGFITISDQYLLNSWNWRIGNDVELLAYTAFGDFFFIEKSTQILYFCDVQYNAIDHLKMCTVDFQNQFLVHSNIREKVLKAPKFDIVKKRLGSLKFGQCYIPVPWPMIGGSGDADTYEIGGFHEYIMLVSQTLNPNVESPFEILNPKV